MHPLNLGEKATPLFKLNNFKDTLSNEINKNITKQIIGVDGTYPSPLF